jgi:hypothetical protein
MKNFKNNLHADFKNSTFFRFGRSFEFSLMFQHEAKQTMFEKLISLFFNLNCEVNLSPEDFDLPYCILLEILTCSSTRNLDYDWLFAETKRSHEFDEN